jgi:hypothetical protein
MKWIGIFILLFSYHAVVAQPAARKKFKRGKTTHAAEFPKSFIGNWKGEMTWYPNGKTAQKVNVELHILPTDTIGQYTWQIIYGSKKEDNRPYILKAVDSIKGHWVVDELNGIVLDGYWLGNRFSGAFAVQGNTILDSYWIENGSLHFQFFSYPQQPEKTTGYQTAESPKVDVYRISSYQKAVLKKIK